MSVRGFLTGSLALIVLYVLVQPRSTAQVGGALGVAQSAFQRALSPNVAAIPNRAAPATTSGSVGEVKALPKATPNTTKPKAGDPYYNVSSPQNPTVATFVNA